MGSFILIVKFFGGLFLLFAFGRIVGHIFRLDDYMNYKSDNHLKQQN
jgi:hypothetical protein